MRWDDDVHRRTAMVLMRHGPLAADFAAMVAAELAKSGDTEGSEAWSAVSRQARTLLSGMPAGGWRGGGDSAAANGRSRASADTPPTH